MKRDPLYRDIIARLNEPLDPDSFEACAVDLLRPDYPGLVPVRGGNDAGFDGEVSDLVSPRYGLVCTTREDPARNLKNSLDAQREGGYQGDRVVFATSRPLTPAVRRKLEQYATERGFTHVAIFDQAAFAPRLYERPAWCKELLGLTGAPSALSISPLTRRPLAQAPLLGRDADRTWLQNTSGDRMLVGQPGSGKTAILYQLARDGWGLFLVDDDRERLANAIRAERPRVVIVDDAHVQPDRLTHLRQLREQIGADFDIVATCWPSTEEQVRHALQLSSSQGRELSLLDRGTIAQVVRNAGLGGPDGLIGAIVTQADGRPGLAVTLAHTCLTGDVAEVMRGDAIVRNIAELLVASDRDENSLVLAAFALGGDAGMPQRALGELLGMPPITMAKRLAELGFAGVVKTVHYHNVDDTYVAVEPPVLRAALVRNVFFRGLGALDFRPLANLAPSRAELAQTLVDAHASGASIPQSLLVPYLDHAKSNSVWRSYASIGHPQVEWILRERGDLTLAVAEPALHHAPRVALPKLIDLATTDLRPTPQTPDHPLRRIEDWIDEANPWHPSGLSAVERRRILAQCTSDWVRRGGDERVGTRALMLVLNPDFRAYSLDPGLGRTVTFMRGTLPDADLEAIAVFWPQVFAVITAAYAVSWPDVFAGIAHWAIPSQWSQLPMPDASRAFMRAKAAMMLEDVVSKFAEQRGVLQQSHALAKRADLDVKVPVDPVFFALYGDYDDEFDEEQAEAQANADFEQLVESWRVRNPDQVASDLAALEREATAVGITYPRRAGVLANRLSAVVGAQIPWLRAVVAAKLGPEIILPFLERATDGAEDGWEETLGEVLADSDLEAAAIKVILTTADPPQHLLDRALQLIVKYVHIVKWCAMRGTIPMTTLRRLLEHPDDAVAGEAAYGEWASDPHGSVRPELALVWRTATLRDPVDYHQHVILEADPTLSYDWLECRVRKGEHLWFFNERDPVAMAIDALDRNERRAILNLLSNETTDPKLVARLVGDDELLFAELLSMESLNREHYAPLMGELNVAWIRKARVALAHGMDPKAIAGATLMQIGGFSGSHSSVLAERLAELERFAEDQEADIAQILEIAITHQKASLERQIAAEHHEAVHGLR